MRWGRGVEGEGEGEEEEERWLMGWMVVMVIGGVFRGGGEGIGLS